jgi:hypothetical protein
MSPSLDGNNISYIAHKSTKFIIAPRTKALYLYIADAREGAGFAQALI